MTDFEAIFRQQQAFFETQVTKPVEFRKQQLTKLKELLTEYEQALFDAIYSDFRKSQFDTYATELGLVYCEIDYYLKNLKELSKPKAVANNLINQPGKSFICTEPLGCTLIIGAWNYPYYLTFMPLVAAMAAGNCAMIKPSELPAATMHTIAGMINTNFPPGYLYVAEGAVEETTEILKLPFDKIFFTGSPKVGRIVYEAAAKNLTPVTLELGGKSPAIVTKHANLEIAARRIVWGKFLNSGQTCIAPDYVVVEEPVAAAFIEAVKKQITKAAYGPDVPHYARIINQRNFERVCGLMDPAKVIFGGKQDAEQLYIEPTLLNPVDWNDAVMQEEIFGPVLPILHFNQLSDVFAEIRKRPKPLSAYLFTDKQEEKERYLQDISFGGGCINDTVMHITNDRMPFGGIGNSGTGHYHGVYGFLTFSHQKSILDKADWGETPLRYPPYSEEKLKWIKKVL